MPALRGGYVWDDDDYVTRNRTLQDAEGLRRIWLELGAIPQYYPLVHTSFWLEHRLWGLRPLGYHLTNVLLHALAAWLVVAILRRLDVPGAWLAGAVFALHPVHVESVAWITERKNVLSGVLYLSAMLAYLRFAGLGVAGLAAGRSGAEGEGQTVDRRRWGFYTLTIVLFAAALLSKTVTCSLPAAVLLVLWWKRGSLGRQDVLALTPLFVLGAAMGLLTVWMEKHHVGASGEAWALTFVDRCLIAGRALWFYAGKLIWPHALTFIYPRWQIDSGLWWQFVYPLAAIAVIVALWLTRGRIGKGPLAAALLFVGTLAPALGFVDVYPMRYSFVADHFQYLASIALIALLAASAAMATRWIGPRARPCTAVACAALLLALSTLTWRQGRIYKDEETLWRDTLAKNPSCLMARSNLGSVLAQQARYAEAAAEYTKALKLDPDSYEVHNNLASAYDRLGRADEALAHYTEALRRQPNDHRVHYNLGIAQARRGQVDQAIEHFATAIRLQPDLPEPRHHLANLLVNQGRTDEAIRHYNRLLRLEPHRLTPANNLAWTLATCPSPSVGEVAQAIRLAKQTCERTSYRQPAFLDTLAAAYAAAGRYDEAVATAEKATELAQALGDERLVAGLRTRTALYKTGKPYREHADSL